MVNEVEIVVTSKMAPLRQYAERIESRVRSLGLAVDVLFPHEDIPLRQVLGDLSTRGILFGIVLSPINQEHASITQHPLRPARRLVNVFTCLFQFLSFLVRLKWDVSLLKMKWAMQNSIFYRSTVF